VSRASSQKNLREKARREKAAAKRERREATAAEAAASAPVEVSPGDQPQVLAELAELHEQYDAEQIDFEEFESRKRELLGRLHV
jgi:gas vesicle protein GvpG